MRITKITIAAKEGEVRIEAIDGGGVKVVHEVSATRRRLIDVCWSDWGRDALHEVARQAAAAICGTDDAGNPLATGSMVNDLRTEIERVAGC